MSVYGYTPHLKLPLINFNSSAWHDDDNSRAVILDAAIYDAIQLVIEGVWANSIAVTAGKVYVDTDLSQLYTCVTSHVTAASGTFAAERLTSPSSWARYTLVTGLTTLGVSAFWQSILDDANAGASLTDLGFSPFFQTLIDDADAATLKASIGANPVGSVIGSIRTTNNANTDITAIIPQDNTIPQISEGTEIMTSVYAATSTTNKIRISVEMQVAAAGSGGYVVSALFVGVTANALAARAVNVTSAGITIMLSYTYEYVPGTTTALTYRVRVGPGAANTIRLNGTTSGPMLGGTSVASMTIEEIKA